MEPDDLDRELKNHLAFEADEQRERGASPAEAHHAARRALGREAAIREDVRALSPLAAVADGLQDLRYGLRLLRKHPGFAAAVALTLALGVGATTTIFSVVDAVLLRPLPYADADRLAMIWEDVNLPVYRNARNTVAAGNFRAWRDESSTFAGMAAVRGTAWSLTGRGEPVRLNGARVSASFFDILQVRPVLGREFTADDEARAGTRVVLIGHGLWTTQFGGDPSVVGQTLLLNDEAYTVIGVMPRGFRFPNPDDQLWVPLGLTAAQLSNHGSHFLQVIGRLRPGATIARAQADLATISARLTKQFPGSNTGVGVAVVSLTDEIVGHVRRPLLLVFGVVGFLLVMACTNIGSLLVARASARGREFAVRAALGAGRTRLLRQLLAEGVLMATLGGLLGLALAVAGVRTLRWLAPADLPRVDDIAVNSTVAFFNFLVAFAAGTICGITPALRARTDVHDALKDGTRSSSAAASLGLRNTLVVVQTALGVIVLVGAGLLLRSYLSLARVPVGFGSDGIMTFRIALPDARYPNEQKRTAFYRAMVERIEAIPGVSSASVISFLPLTLSGRSTGIAVEGEAPRPPGQIRMVDFRSVSPGYLGTMSIPLLSGRDVAWSDTPSTQPVLVVSETAARTFWPNQSALGKRIKLGRPEEPEPWLTVVGVVGDVRQLDLVGVPRPAVYFPASQDHGTGDTLRDWVVRTAGDPLALLPAIRSAVWSVDSMLPITRAQTMAQVRAAATASQQFTLMLVGGFAVLALLLAAIGLYGVAAQSVAERTRELGIRVALGARREAVLRLVLSTSARLTLAGLMTGLLASLALTRFMATLLFGIGPCDPATFAGVALLLLAVSMLASFGPAHRATRVDPVIALRN